MISEPYSATSRNLSRNMEKPRMTIFSRTSAREIKFFAVMRPRLKRQNPAKHLDRGALDRDLMVLQWALQNKVPVDEGLDWRLLGIIEEYKRGNVNVHLNQPNLAQSCDLPSVDTAWPAYNLPDSYYKH